MQAKSLFSKWRQKTGNTKLLGMNTSKLQIFQWKITTPIPWNFGIRGSK
jgi:hypothetical protein